MPIALSSTTPLSLPDSCTKMPGLRCCLLAKAKVIIATEVSVHRNLSKGELTEQRYISELTTSSLSILTFIRYKFLAVQIKACSVCPQIQRPYRALHKSLPDRRVRTMRRKGNRTLQHVLQPAVKVGHTPAILGRKQGEIQRRKASW